MADVYELLFPSLPQNTVDNSRLVVLNQMIEIVLPILRVVIVLIP